MIIQGYTAKDLSFSIQMEKTYLEETKHLDDWPKQVQLWPAST